MAFRVGLLRSLAEWASPLLSPSGDGPSLGISRGLLAVAQVSSLAAMAYGYFLAPQFAWVYSFVAVGWFLCLTVPSVTVGPLGVAGQRLIAASAGRTHVPGYLGFTLRVTARYLVFFAWPAVIAAILPPPAGARSAEPLVALVSLIVAAGLLVGVVTLAGPSRRDLARSIMIVLAALAMAAVVSLPKPPFLPGGSRRPAVEQPE
jgi:hypothetical protein